MIKKVLFIIALLVVASAANENGPAKGTPGTGCDSFNSCQTCSQVQFCGWCDHAKKCMHVEKGPCDFNVTCGVPHHYQPAKLVETDIASDSLPGKVVVEADEVDSLKDAQNAPPKPASASEESSADDRNAAAAAAATKSIVEEKKGRSFSFWCCCCF